MHKSIVVTLSEEQYHILAQALHGRRLQLEDRAETFPHMLCAIPVLREIDRIADDAYRTALAATRFNKEKTQ